MSYDILKDCNVSTQDYANIPAPDAFRISQELLIATGKTSTVVAAARCCVSHVTRCEVSMG